MKDEQNKITATLKVVITGEFYDDEASEETLRYCVEQDLEDAGFDVDVELLKEQEAVEPKYKKRVGGFVSGLCPTCGTALNNILNVKACGKCGQGVKWK